MFTVVVVVVVVAVFGGLFVAGILVTNANSPRTRAPAGEQRSEDCAEACTAWDNARQELCNAKSDEEQARARADAKRTELLAAIAFAATLAGMAVAAAVGAGAASAFPWVAAALWVIAAAAAVVALAAAAVATFLAGELAALESDFSAKANVRTTWENAVTDARAAVNNLCSQEEANECLSRTAPC